MKTMDESRRSKLLRQLFVLKSSISSLRRKTDDANLLLDFELIDSDVDNIRILANMMCVMKPEHYGDAPQFMLGRFVIMRGSKLYTNSDYPLLKRAIDGLGEALEECGLPVPHK